MSVPARPLRFLGLVIASYVGLRIWTLTAADAPQAPRLAGSVPARRIATPPARQTQPSPPLMQARIAAPAPVAMPGAPDYAHPPRHLNRPASTDLLTAVPKTTGLPSRPRIATAPGLPRQAPDRTAPATPTTDHHAPKPARRHWGGYGWAYLRESGDMPGLADHGQLGGSQTGIRLDYRPRGIRRHGPLLTLRASAAARGRDALIAPGIGWAYGRMRLVAERRVPLRGDGPRGLALGLAGGMARNRLGGGFAIEGHAQAGLVGLRRRAAYADGLVRLSHPIAARTRTRLDAALSLGAAAQPGVARLDLGLGARGRITQGHRAIGVEIGWRQRVAGRARPGHGLVFSLDTGF